MYDYIIAAMENESFFQVIKEYQKQGKTKEEIYKILLEQGKTVDSIRLNFQKALLEKDESRTPQEDKEETQKRTIRIILIVAAILIGAGIFSFIAANWQAMNRYLKVFLILIFMVFSYSLGWFLKESKYEKTGDALIFLGTLIFGADIFLVGQIFNMRAGWPDGIILWFMGILAIAYALEAFPLYLLAGFIGLIASVGYPSILQARLGNDPYLITSFLLLFATGAATYYIGVHVRKSIKSDMEAKQNV